MADPESIIVPIKKTLRWLVIATVALWLALAGVAAWNRVDATKVNDALCALRNDLERRVVTSERFLVDHPDGIPGIPARTIRDGIKNQRRTIDALSSLSC